MYAGNLKGQKMTKRKYSDDLMRRVSVWVDPRLWEEFGEVVPPHCRSDVLRAMMHRFVLRKKRESAK